MYSVKRQLTILLVLLVTIADVCLARESHVAQQAHAVMQAFFDAGESPGLAVAVGQGNRIIWSGGFGFADVEQSVKVDASTTLFRIGSVIKPMTAHAVAQLVQAGKLDLDAPIQTYVPDFPVKRAPISTRQLLAHLSGIRHYGEGEFLSRQHYDTVNAGLVIFKDDPLLHAPGERYRYSSYGYNLVSAVIEAVSGINYLDYMSANVFIPLGMDSTVADVLKDIIPGRGRYYYMQDGELLNAPEVDNSYKWASGGVIGTVNDLVRFGLAQFEDGALAELVHAQFWEEQSTSAGEKTGYGLGWSLKLDDNGRRWVGHGGGSVGGTTQFWMRPDTGLVIAMISNLSDFEYGTVMVSLERVFDEVDLQEQVADKTHD